MVWDIQVLTWHHLSFIHHFTLGNWKQIITKSAIKEAKNTGTKMCIAVVDSGADLKSFVRMDDAWMGSTDIAIKKAGTACLFGMPTEEIGKLSQPG